MMFIATMDQKIKSKSLMSNRAGKRKIENLKIILNKIKSKAKA